MFQPKGVIAPIITPMHDDESLHEEQLRVQINRLIDNGISGIFVLGTNGEVYALSTEEKCRVIKVAVEEVRGRVPVYAGVGCISTTETVAMARTAQELGADALSVVSPYFVGVKQDDLIRHYDRVAAAVTLPIILYNMPARTGNNIDYKTVRQLAEKHSNIIGVKDSSGSFDNTLRYIEDTPAHVSVLAGNDSLILWTLQAGGAGAIAGWSNVFPRLMSGIYEAWKDGDMELANKRQKMIRPFRDVMAMGNPNSVVKRALNLLGQPVGPAREPVGGVSPAIDEALKKAFQLYSE